MGKGRHDLVMWAWICLIWSMVVASFSDSDGEMEVDFCGVIGW